MDQQQCAGFGFAPGSDGFANCVMRVSHQRQAEVAAEQAKQRQAEQDAANKAASEKSYQDCLVLSGLASGSAAPPVGGAEPSQPPTTSHIPGMVCEGEGDDASCDAR